MIVGCMQPYFFPYLGHFQLIARVERWIVFDIVKYSRRTWMNRNRVLSPRGGWHYLTVPVTVPHAGMIKDAVVLSLDASRRRILGQLAHYRRKAPYYEEAISLVEQAFASTDSPFLVDLDVQSLVVVCRYLGIAFDYEILSTMGLALPPISYPGQWALEVCDKFGATGYVNPSGARAIFRPEEWVDRRIALEFLEPAVFRYTTGPYPFAENLSILDVIMWNSPDSIVRAIRTSPGRAT